MDYETPKVALLKEARNAFETACTLRENQRIEVYLHEGEAKVSDILEENDELIYTPARVLCYRVHGHDYLEAEIKTWIDYARVVPQPEGDAPSPEPAGIEQSIREIVGEIAERHGVENDAVSSYEIFANLSMDLLGSIEQQIIEYWWNADGEENGKMLALAQIEEALGKAPVSSAL